MTWDPAYAMPLQQYNWTCSVCSLTWVLQSSGTAYVGEDVYAAREQVGQVLGYPNCVNETYGCMSAQCVVNAFRAYGLAAIASSVTFDTAYAICRQTTGVINPHGMYHFMAVRGTDGVEPGDIWVANSASPSYYGVGDSLTRDKFNALGPVTLIYLEQPQP